MDESNSRLSTKRCTTEQGNFNKSEPPEWKKGTVPILGDSMISGIDEKRFGSNGSVMVRSLPGSKIHDIHNYFMKPLLKKIHAR